MSTSVATWILLTCVAVGAAMTWGGSGPAAGGTAGPDPVRRLEGRRGQAGAADDGHRGRVTRGGEADVRVDLEQDLERVALGLLEHPAAQRGLEQPDVVLADGDDPVLV